ncbi:hypothetical protein [Saccharothrix saharensis]|uniref:hypothetical protein n=1 Tax=Saccharothrix saharensis TaxID=571190 RepID=UPI001B870191|nr:hypothetical protein [Saccharothrix saharensis]
MPAEQLGQPVGGLHAEVGRSGTVARARVHAALGEPAWLAVTTCSCSATPPR